MFDVIIVGAGPAGLTAGLYTGRYRLKTLIVEKMVVGGQIILSERIENFPGFPGGIATQELIDRMKQQAGELGVEFRNAEVISIEPEQKDNVRSHTVACADMRFEARSVIVATGAHWKRLGVPGEEKFIGRGVSFCATCDAPFFKDKEVIVVGGGDKAIEEALLLTKYAGRVTVIHRRKALRATEILQEQAKANPKIAFVLDSVIDEIRGTNKVGSVRVKHVHTGAVDEISCQGVFIFVGIQPTTEFVKKTLEMDESGFIITDDHMKASQDGIFACGDCREKFLYQVVTACGEGAVAAHSAHNYLLHLT